MSLSSRSGNRAMILVFICLLFQCGLILLVLGADTYSRVGSINGFRRGIRHVAVDGSGAFYAVDADRGRVAIYSSFSAAPTYINGLILPSMVAVDKNSDFIYVAQDFGAVNIYSSPSAPPNTLPQCDMTIWVIFT